MNDLDKICKRLIDKFEQQTEDGVGDDYKEESVVSKQSDKSVEEAENSGNDDDDDAEEEEEAE